MPTRYRWDDFVLDLDAYRLERAGEPVPLEPKALNLLALMVQRPGHAFSKQEIFSAVWPDTAVTDHALTRVVAQLRRALGDEAREARYIETVPTRGYRWIRPVDESPAAVAGDDARPTVAAAAPIVQASLAAARVPMRLQVSPAAAAAFVLVAVTAGLVWTVRGSLTGTDAAASPGMAPAWDYRARDLQWPLQVTTHEGLDLHPAFSPQGDAVTYASDRTGGFELFIRTLGGAATDTALTSDEGQNVQPVWSPDGRFIAYHSARRGGIWVIPSRGGVARQLVAFGSNPAWSPDGGRLAFQSDEHADVTPTAFGAQAGSTIWTVQSDGRDLREVTALGRPGGGHAVPVWSPDGRAIAFTVFEGGADNGVWLVRLDTLATGPLARGPGLFEIVFAPDGSALYVAGGIAAIVRLPLDPATATVSGPQRVLPVPGVPGIRGLTISSDGRRLAFAGLGLNSQIWAQRVRAEGAAIGVPSPLTRDTSRRNSLPVISRDGTRVAYVSTRGGELPNVWVIGIDGTGAMQVTPNETSESKPSWYPDSNRVAYLSYRDGRLALWSVDLTTRREELAIDLARVRPQGGKALPGPLGEVELAPSMTRAVFSLLPPPGRRVLYLTTLDPVAPRALTDGTTSVGYPAWSPDERRIAVEMKDGSSVHAALIDAETGALRQLTRTPGQTWVSSWSPDGRRIAAASQRGGLWSLQWIDPESGRETAITEPEAPHIYVRYPDWSPRGDLIVYERGELRGNIWTIAVP